jgi:hypothetical protein
MRIEEGLCAMVTSLHQRTHALTMEDHGTPPRYVVENYRIAYVSAHGREPAVRYMGNHWYYVNGETVHRVTLLEEIERLRAMPPKQSFRRTDRSIVQRLIDRLRAL